VTGDEFRSLVLAALDEPATDEELRQFGCQCAADIAQVYLARIDAIVNEDRQ
jgi:hypothetical protein